MRPLVSVIIPVHNRRTLINDAIQSALDQTWRPLEIIVVDDGSTDDTTRTAGRLAEQYAEVKVVSLSRSYGPGHARATGLARSHGDFIQYLDSDDLLLPRKFEFQISTLQRNPDREVCYGRTLRRNLKTGEERVWARTGEEIDNIFPSFLMRRGWDTNSPLWRRSACERIGPWAPLRVMEDWEHDVRAGLLGIKPVQVRETVAVIRDHAGDRASGMTAGFTPEIMVDFFRAHRNIWARMKEAGRTDWSYLESFSHKMFWIARMCARQRLWHEAEEAIRITEEMVGERRCAVRWFHRATRLLGWRTTVAIGETAYRVVRGVRSVTAVRQS